MQFNSLTFITFLICIYIFYWLFNKPNFQKYLILFSSLIFYSFWRIEFLPLLIFSVLANYYFAIYIFRIKKNEFIFLSIFVGINLLILFYFKYLIFFTDTIFSLAKIFSYELDFNLTNIILPLGISFYTFQSISYIVDIYRRDIKPEKDFFFFASYITFFPQLVAGPILRASQVIPQLRENKNWKLEHFISGFERILFGLFLKVVLADNIAILVDSGFSVPKDDLSAIDVWTLAFLFGFQIYFDFSAYSHIAIGVAKILGITFPENFDFPYSSTSPREFWKRWHISLSSWIKDYLYLPLTNYSNKYNIKTFSTGISSAVTEKNIPPLIYTWALMGLWHGANWTFLLWGILHAVIILIYRLISLTKLKLDTFLTSLTGWLLTILSVMIVWIPFRASNIRETLTMYSKVFNPLEYFDMNLKENLYLVAAVLLLVTYLASIIYKFYTRLSSNSKLKLFTSFIIYLTTIPLIIIFIRPINQFIYFQF